MIDWLQTHLGMSPQLQTRLLVTVGTIVGLWLLRHFVLGFVYRRVQDPWGRDRWRKGVTYALVTVGVILVAQDRESTRLNSSHVAHSYAVFCLEKKKKIQIQH